MIKLNESMESENSIIEEKEILKIEIQRSSRKRNSERIEADNFSSACDLFYKGKSANKKNENKNKFFFFPKKQDKKKGIEKEKENFKLFANFKEEEILNATPKNYKNKKLSFGKLPYSIKKCINEFNENKKYEEMEFQNLKKRSGCNGLSDFAERGCNCQIF